MYIGIIIYYFNSVILSTNDKFLNKMHEYTNIVTIKKNNSHRKLLKYILSF